MCATAENVVPRSIPTALRLLMWSFLALPFGISAQRMQFSCPPRVIPDDYLPRCERDGSGKLFDDHFCRSQHLAVPGKSAFHLPNEHSVFRRILGGLNCYHFLPGAIGLCLRFHFTDFKAMQNRNQKVEQIVKVISQPCLMRS